MQPGLSVSDTGSGPTVLLLHGQPGSRYDWRQVSALLADDHRVLVPDRPGYGRSNGPAVGMSDNADLLATMLISRSTGAVIVVGHSYAGGIAVLLAVSHPELVRGLVLAAPLGHRSSVTAIDRLLAKPIVGDLLSAVGLYALGRVLPSLRRTISNGHKEDDAQKRSLDRLKRWLAASLPDDQESREMLKPWRRILRSFVTEQRAMVREIGSVEAALGQIAVPTVVVAGDMDVVVASRAAAATASGIRGSELIKLPSVGHFLPRDAPEVLAQAVRRVAL